MQNEIDCGGSNDLNCIEIEIDPRNGEQFIYYCERTLPSVCVSEKDRSVVYQLISFSWDKTKYLFSRYGLVKFENERRKIEKKNENKK